MNQHLYQSTKNEVYDVVVIGAGVVGCAIARRFTLEGAKTLVIEACHDILEGASKGNSAILHTGFDAPANSVELDCVQKGYQEYFQIRKKLGLPVLKTGALVIAWTQEEEARLQGVLEKACSNGVTNVQMLSASQVLDLEPNLSSRVKAGISVPGECVIDPWTAPYLYLLQALSNGAKLLRGTSVAGGVFDGRHWKLDIGKETVFGNTVINCAGLFGDKLDEILLGHSNFEIRPRKGQFLVYDKAASILFKSIVLPVPTDTTKGVVITQTIFGNVLVGPTAEDQASREDATIETEVLHNLRKQGEKIIPQLADHPITATYAGIRPATQYKDYCIRFESDMNYVSVGGIRSTGLSAALGIARFVHAKHDSQSWTIPAPNKITWPTAISLAQTGPRDWMNCGNGGIVCHCELVTRREIEQALCGPLAAASLSALKRRTRVTMGRCQGFYCSAALSQLTKGHFVQPIGVDHERA